MTTTTEIRFGRVREVRGECDCVYGPLPPYRECASGCPTHCVVAYEADVLERCPEWCEDGERGFVALPGGAYKGGASKCPRCADSPEPGRVVKKCGECRGTKVSSSDPALSWRVDGPCLSCSGTGKATVHMKAERYREIVRMGLSLLVDHRDFKYVTAEDAAFALHVAKGEG